ncbi:MAG TPA: VCBS repeat-containing protein [Chthonomonadales bacterium]|nr:VCBS repeat-containing protein [Chthonomonadales bacterium]
MTCTTLRRASFVVAAALIGLLSSAAGAQRRAPEISFRRIVLDTRFVAEGCAVADVNRDGRPDVMAGNLWYQAPDWTPREIAPVQQFDGAAGYSNCFFVWAADLNRDGWPDQIMIGMPGGPIVWRENPRGGTAHWKEHRIAAAAGNESPEFRRLFPRRGPVLVAPDERHVMRWLEPDTDPTAPFRSHAIGEPNQPGTQQFSHGLGVGDINGDGRPDVVTKDGWYEAPADPTAGLWPFRPASLGGDAAQMLVYDVNADGLADVISSSAHAIGVWWHEQRRGPSGVEWVQHTIDDTWSQAHAIELVDMNGDGLMDFVTGKRFWAHGPTGDVQPDAPAVLYWYELRRGPQGVSWTRHQIDNDSGVGTQLTIADVNRDRLPDVVVANKKGVFVHLQVRQRR